MKVKKEKSYKSKNREPQCKIDKNMVKAKEKQNIEIYETNKQVNIDALWNLSLQNDWIERHLFPQ